MQVNTSIVRALMYLRNIGEGELANIAQVRLSDMRAWLYELGEDSENRVEFDTQLEILRILGIVGDGPRPDVVHYWRVYEPLFSRASDSYWALSVMLKAFGKAQVAYLAREADPALTFRAQAHFGLRFPRFTAILDITAHPLRNISFDPAVMPDLSWVPDTQGVLLEAAEYDALEPGAMKVKNMQQYLTYTAEVAQWERLRDAAMQQGLRVDQIATMLLGAPLSELKPALPPAEPATVEQVLAPAGGTDDADDDELSLFTRPVKATPH